MGTVEVSEQELEQLETLAKTRLLNSNDWMRHDMGKDVEDAEAEGMDEKFINAFKIIRDDEDIRVYEKTTDE